jgi:hypothetical protein
MFALLAFTQLTPGQQSWGAVGCGVDSGVMDNQCSGKYVTVHSTVADEVQTAPAPLRLQTALAPSACRLVRAAPALSRIVRVGDVH